MKKKRIKKETLVKIDSYRGVDVFISKEAKNWLARIGDKNLRATSFTTMRRVINGYLEEVAGASNVSGMKVVVRTGYPSTYKSGVIKGLSARQSWSRQTQFDKLILVKLAGISEVGEFRRSNVFFGLIKDAKKIEKLSKARVKMEKEIEAARNSLKSLDMLDLKTLKQLAV